MSVLVLFLCRYTGIWNLLKLTCLVEELADSTLIISVLDANRMGTDIHIRLVVSRGLKKTPYQHPNANIGGSTIVIIPEYKKADKTINKKGISLATVSARRGTADTQDPRLNTLSKLNCIFACIEADKKGADEVELKSLQ